MRIKIADKWYEVDIDQPIMIELTDKDKENIRNMSSSATKYAIFHDLEPKTIEQKWAWME